MPGVRASLATSLSLSLSLSLFSLWVRVLVSTSLAGVVSHARGACVTSHVPELSLSLSLSVLSLSLSSVGVCGCCGAAAAALSLSLSSCCILMPL